jgi:16S rRNA (guanine966-N2)-methyltransferase
MRIISGQFRGRPLVAPKGEATRPTAGRTRESLFNVLAHADWAPSLEGARVIDLFAGSGALGFEAISRGAAICLFVETAEAARGAIRTNAEALGLMGRTRVHRRSATDLGSRPGGEVERFGVAFLDAPYSQGLTEPALAALRVGGWLTPEALVIVELAEEEPLDLVGYEELDRRAWGVAEVRFLRPLP